MSELFLICDTSGSMVENGKRFICRNVVRTLDQCCRLRPDGVAMRLVAWGASAQLLDWHAGEDCPDVLLACSGDANGETLVALLGSEQQAYFAILTDGYWSPRAQRQLRTWAQQLPPDHLRIIKIGEDANPRLKGPSVFSTEELLAALDGWIKDEVQP